MALTLIAAPTVEPVTTAEAKAHLRVDHTADDTLIDALITSARMSAEERMQRSILTQTWELTLDEFPEGLKLTRGPVASVSSVKYLDEDGTLQTLDPADYQVDVYDPWYAWVVPALDMDWPVTQENINAVRVRYVAGFADAARVPAPIKSWILLMVGALYTHREAAAAGTEVKLLPFVDRLLDPWTVVAV